MAASDSRLASGGYSGTPLARKLGVKEGSALVLDAAPDGWTIPELPAGVVLGGDPPDVVVAFCRSAGALRSAVASWGPRVFPAAALWIAWPRKAAGHVSDVDENLIREVALPTGLVDTKVAALDQDWSGLKLVWRRELR